jgi:tetratricopeptide (TPR) repeat protein
MSDTQKASRQPAQIYIAAGLACLTLLVYWPTLQHSFVHYDDQYYVFENPHVQAGLTANSVGWAFTTFHCANWHPLTWLSLELDAHILGGQTAGGFHATNILLHAANTALLFLVLARMTGRVWRSAVVAALFGLHPLHVESVAWVAERKDVLSTFFWMLTMAAYDAYARKPEPRRFLLLFVLLGLGLMAKPMLVTLPCVLLLLDYWPLGRWTGIGGTVTWRRLLLEKLPLFALVLVFCVVTFVAQRERNAVGTIEKYPLDQRIYNALWAYVLYIGKTVWPMGLAPFYPHPGARLAVGQALAAGLLLLVVTTFAILLGRRWRYVPVGWLWFVGTLVPVIGLVQVGEQALADRYTYVPLIGVFIVAAWGVGDLIEAYRLPSVVSVSVVAVVLGVLAMLTWTQVGYWQDDITLWSHTTQVTKDNTKAHDNLGEALADANRHQEAIDEFRKSLEINPKNLATHQNLGAALHKQGRVDQAMAEYQEALAIDPTFAQAHHNLGVILSQRGRRDEAIAHFQREIETDPDQPGAHFALGTLFMDMGRLDEAASELRRAIALDPQMFQADGALGEVLLQQGLYGEAETIGARAVAAIPTSHPARNLVLGQAQRCRRMHALEQKLLAVLEGNAQPADARENLDIAWLCQLPRHGRYASAARFYAAAFAADPKIVNNARLQFRYHAACAAARASTGLEKDGATLTNEEGSRLRVQALTWLQADFAFWAREAASDRVENRASAERALRTMKQERAFECVRDPSELAKLPASESELWKTFWADVDTTFSLLSKPRP